MATKFRARISLLMAASALAALILTSCSSGAGTIGTIEMGNSGVTPETSAIEDMQGDRSAESLTQPPISADGSRSIIRSAGLTVEVGDVRESASEVAEIARDLGGYVETQNLSKSGGGAIDQASLTLRVPAARLDETLSQLSELGEVRDEHLSSTDVTMQHVDLQARVESLEASIGRLTELMSGAATTGELIEAESALAARQAELDGLRAQLESLEGQVEESAVWVTLTTASAIPGGPANFWEGLLAGLQSLQAAAAGALVLLGVLVPWIAVAAIIAFVVLLVVRAAKRRR